MIRLFLAVVAGLLIVPDIARGDLTVDLTTDAPADGECAIDCTLRDAVALADGETIHLGAGTYNLTLGQLSIVTRNFTVEGQGARSTTIHSNGNGRVANVDGSSIVEFTDVTVSGGSAVEGGAFNVTTAAELRLLRVTLKDNRAADRGGAIATFGDLSFTESTASGNRAGGVDGEPGSGGAIYVGTGAGAVALLNSTLSGNTALSGGDGGGLYAADDYKSDFVTIANNTAGNGGGLFHGDATGSVHNTLIADNTGGACGGTPTLITEDFNLTDDTTCVFTEPGDHQVTGAKIGPLADNGGQTDTHGLHAGSLAVGNADATLCESTDQRGVARPQPTGGQCDIGAFEGTVPADYTVDLQHDDGDGLCSDGDCTLRDAVDEAVAGDRIFLPPGTYPLEQGSLTLVGDQIVGENARTTIVDGGRNDERVLQATGGNNRVSGVTITGGEESTGGGALVQGAGVSLTLTEVTVRENFANDGGGVANFGATLDIIRSTITENEAGAPTDGGTGGGIHTVQGLTRVRNATVSANRVSNGETFAEGGGFSVVGGTLTATNVTIADNHAGRLGIPDGGGGSAIDISSVLPATVTLANTIVSGNGPFACAGAGLTASRTVVDDSTCGSPVRNALLGGLADNGGQTDTHAIGATSPAVDGGAGCDPTDQRGLPRKRACDIGAFEYQGTLPPSGGGQQQPPPPPGDKQLPPPQAGKNVNALPESGVVKIKLPGTGKFIVLTEGLQIPVGTIVDARKGHVTLIAAGGGDAEFYGGIFKIGQGKGAKPLTTLTLVEKLTCAKKSTASAAAKKKRKRRLWGDGKGRFRTKGKHSAATVVGTKWLVEDRCTSTLTRVVRGKVKVRDFGKKKTVTVKAGKKYVARARP